MLNQNTELTSNVGNEIMDSISNIKTNFQKSETFMTLSKGVIELRNLIFKMVLAFVLGLIVSYFYQTPIYNLYITPLKSNNLTLHFLSPLDSVMFYIKIYAISALIISLPLQIILFWQYIKEALLEKERKFIQGYFWVGSILSLGAIIYGWLVLVPSIFTFIISFNPPQTQLLLTATEYSSFIVGILLMLIVSFQIPVVIFTLIVSGILTVQQITDKRKHIYVSVLIGTSIFGSPDILTWIMSAIPVILLIEFSIIVAKFKLQKNLINSNTNTD